MAEQEIDFTDETSENEAVSEIKRLKSEIVQLESKLKFPMGFKMAVAGGLISYILAKKYIGNEMAIAGALGGAVLSYRAGQSKEITPEIKQRITEEIYKRKKRLQSLGVILKAEETGSLTASEIENLDYDKLIFDGDVYGDFMGNPAVGFHALVYGLPKSGKSIWSLQFADYLANNFGDVIYIAAEEGFKGTIKDKIKDWTSNRDSLVFSNARTYEEIDEAINGQDFVFIDSLDFAKITVDEVEQLKADNPKTSFVTIKQVTKDGKFRGSQEYAHNCDIIISIADGVAEQKGRYNAGGEMLVFGENDDE